MDFPSANDDELMMAAIVEDPTARDLDSDPIVVTTRRALSRIAFVAAETASRFEREGIEHDPVAWMMTPRRIFEGSAAIDACLELRPFLRAAILHGLSRGLDALPEEIDSLLGDDDDDDFEPDYIEEAYMHAGSGGRSGRMSMFNAGLVSLAIPSHRTPVRHAARGAATCRGTRSASLAAGDRRPSAKRHRKSKADTSGARR